MQPIHQTDTDMLSYGTDEFRYNIDELSDNTDELSDNNHRSFRSTSEEIELRVSAEPGDEEPPRFVATPQPQTVIEGQSAAETCPSDQ